MMLYFVRLHIQVNRLEPEPAVSIIDTDIEAEVVASGVVALPCLCRLMMLECYMNDDMKYEQHTSNC